MQIRCWGSRGQIPVSGPEFNKYGGDTTCIEIRSSQGDIIIIDSGSGIRNLGAQLLNEDSKKINLIFTHLHLDHIMGLPFFSPLYNREYSINVYGCPFKEKSFEDALRGMMRAPYFPVDLKDVPSKLQYFEIYKRSFRVGSISVKPILLNHPNGGLGYRFEENGVSFVFLTDNELGADLPGSLPFTKYINFCKNADLLIHDAEFDINEYARYKSWGHSTYNEAVKLGLEAKVKMLGLFHVNNKRTDIKVDSIVRAARVLVRNNDNCMECFAVGNRFSIVL